LFPHRNVYVRVRACFGNHLRANPMPTRSYHEAHSNQEGLEGNWRLITVVGDSEEKI
jgi:hypothetical protein